MYPGMFWDPTYLLVLIGALLCMAAQMKVKTTFGIYSQVNNHTGLTGRMAAEKILAYAGLANVKVEHVRGHLTDHFDPRSNTLRLSDATYGAATIGAVAVAAHECGHAIQHAKGYAPLSIRSALVPAANFGAKAAWPLILIGLFFRSQTALFLLEIGVIGFGLAVLFQFVTLPVEFNASNRALKILETTGLLGSDEMAGAKKVLFAAALTYVAGAASAALQFLRILILTGGRRRDD